jgi:hypothetical protein
VTVSVPEGRNIRYTIFSASGQAIRNGTIEPSNKTITIDLVQEKPGLYLVRFLDKNGVTYIARVIKQ